MDIKDYKECQRELLSIESKVNELASSIDVDSLKRSLTDYEKETINENFWEDKARFTFVNKEISRLKKRVEPWKELLAEINDAVELMEMAFIEEDSDILQDICDKIQFLNKMAESIENIELLSGEDDLNNAFITIHPGAGGTESQDWANMLMRMYTRWSDQNGLKVEIVDYLPGEEAGIKSVTLLIKGDYAFGLLKGEFGVHRLVRISPFDANKRRHTSFASVEVVPEIDDNVEIDIQESDLRIDTYRASGAGGQHVNKTDSAIRITHIPTGVVVQCQNERSQHKNKAYAMKMLKSRLYDIQKEEQKNEKEGKMGDKKEISWGSQIRSYVFQPYTMVKDHRTNEETGSVEHVFNGDLNRFIYAYLRSITT